MPYRLTPGRPIDREVRRTIDRQLELALRNLSGLGGRRRDKATHGARRHIKKIRALLRLFQPSPGRSARQAHQRLRAVSRLLAPIADAEAVVDTLARIGTRYRADFPRRTYAAVHNGLLRIEHRTRQKAAGARVLDKAMRLLRAEQQRSGLWRLDESGFRAVAPGLKESVRRTHRAMERALRHPTYARYHEGANP
jgi:hypothetical protein